MAIFCLVSKFEQFERLLLSIDRIEYANNLKPPLFFLYGATINYVNRIYDPLSLHH